MPWLLPTLLLLAGASPTHNGELAGLLFPTLKSFEIKAEILEKQKAFEGPGAAELKAALESSAQRDERMAVAAAAFAALEAAMGEVDAARDDEAKQALRERLETLSQVPMQEATTALNDAVTFERGRIASLLAAREKALTEAQQLPGVDKKKLKRMQKEAASEKLPAVIEGRVGGYRFMALGLIDYLGADYPAAVENMRKATEIAPDLAQAYVYLGSFAYIIRKRSVAIEAWRRALELRPNDAELRAALDAITD